MPHLMFVLLISAAQAYTFQSNDILNQKTVHFPSPKAKASVVAFLSAKCPCSASHEKALGELAKKYSADGFEFIGVHSNQNETESETTEHFKAAALPFPVLNDQGAKIANDLKALKTPHVYVIQNQKIVYEGGMDDSSNAAEATKFFLADALAEIKNNKPVTLAKARALGCQIKR